MISWNKCQNAYEKFWVQLDNGKGDLRHWSMLLIVSLIFFAILIETSPVRNVMEARNFKTASEMLESGQWLLPTLNGEPRVEKPALPTWAVALMGYLFHSPRDPFLLRIPNALVGLILLFFFYNIVKNLYHKRLALWSTLILASAVQFFGEIQIARWDMFSSAFGIAGLWAAIKLWAQPQAPVSTLRYIIQKSWFFFLFVLFWSAAYWSKGPIAMYAILLPFLLSVLIIAGLEKRGVVIPSQDNFPKIKGWDWLALLILIGIVMVIGNSWWYWLKLWYPETWERLYQDISSVQLHHPQAWHFYIYRAIFLIAPWTIIWIAAWILIGHSILALDFFSKRPYIRKLFGKSATPALPGSNSASNSDPDSSNEKISSLRESLHNHGWLFAILWMFLSLAALSIVPAKKNRYFFPILPSCAMFLAVFIDYVLFYASKMFKFYYVRYLFHLQKIGLIIAWSAVPFGIALFILLYSISFWYAAIVPLWAVYLKLLWKTKPDHRLVYQTAITMVLLAGLFLGMLSETHWLDGKYQNTYPTIAQITKDKPLYIWGDRDDELLWAIGRNACRIWKKKDLPNDESHAFVMISSLEKGILQERYGPEHLRLLHQFTEKDGLEEIPWLLYQLR